MKKVIIASILLITFLFSSCVPDTPLPEGVWISEDPNIVLFMDQEYTREGYNFVPTSETGRFLGIYTLDDEEIKVFVSFHISRQSFRILPITAIDVRRGGVMGDETLFNASFRIEGNRMYYSSGIIFYRVEDPESVHPLNWTIPPRD